MMQVSMSDSINAVQDRYTRFTPDIAPDPNASAEAAAAAAAREILMRQYPGQKARIDTAFAAMLEKVPDSPARAAGIALREKVAGSVFADRQNDDTNVPDTYRPLTRPGVWVPTTPPLFSQYATARPWGMKAANQFRPGPPPKLSSTLYARDYNETKEFGGLKSVKRTDAQSDAVRFWAQGNLFAAWYQAAAQISARRGLGLAENARLFGLLSMGIANCYILDWDAKFHYQFWRPLTAIRNGDQDGNDATARQAARSCSPPRSSRAAPRPPRSICRTSASRSSAWLPRSRSSCSASVRRHRPRTRWPSTAAGGACSAIRRCGAAWRRGCCGAAGIRMRRQRSRTPTSRSSRPTCSPACMCRSSCSAASTASNTWSARGCT